MEFVLPFGLQLKKIDNKNILKLILIFIVIFMIMAIIYLNIYGKFITTNKYKYPPRLYYLSYAISLSLLSYYLIERKHIFNLKEHLNTKLIIFISSHTMWIYLWHILYIIIINNFFNTMNWIIKFLVVILLAIFTTYIQSKCVKKINNAFINTILDC